MSTSALIMISGGNIVIYKNMDGYPDGQSGVIEWLEPFVREYKSFHPNMEPCGFPAILLRHQAAFLLKSKKTLGDVTIEASDIVRSDGSVEKYRRADFFSWSLHTREEADTMGADYTYVVRSNGNIAIYKGMYLQQPVLRVVEL